MYVYKEGVVYHIRFMVFLILTGWIKISLHKKENFYFIIHW